MKISLLHRFPQVFLMWRAFLQWFSEWSWPNIKSGLLCTSLWLIHHELYVILMKQMRMDYKNILNSTLNVLPVSDGSLSRFRDIRNSPSRYNCVIWFETESNWLSAESHLHELKNLTNMKEIRHSSAYLMKRFIIQRLTKHASCSEEL
jgi:hypothetical protein